MGILDDPERPDARPLRLGPGGRANPAARTDRRSAELRLHAILVPERPARLRPGRRPAGALLQLGRSAGIRVLEPSRGLDRPRRRPRPGGERARRHRPLLRATGSRGSSPPPSSGSNGTASPSAASGSIDASSNASPILSRSTADIAWRASRAEREGPAQLAERSALVRGSCWRSPIDTRHPTRSQRPCARLPRGWR